MRAWITGVFAASLLASLAMALTPEGRVRTVTRMVCGLVCALAIASPLLELDVGSLAVGIAEYRRQAQTIGETAEEEGKMLERTYIEEQCAAYICAKAEEIGAAADGASVLARWDDGALAWYPWQAEIDGPYSRALSRCIEGELGIPAERQTWRDDG